jgi:aspartokinase
MKVLKFGGSSVANAANIQKVAGIIKRGSEAQVIVVSALGGGNRFADKSRNTGRKKR